MPESQVSFYVLEPKGWQMKHKNPRQIVPAEIRFWKYVNKTESCWLWTGALSKSGYGQFGILSETRKSMRAHCYSWLLHFGPIPDGLCVCHDCRPNPDSRACVNPIHLWLGTNQDNTKDSIVKGTFAAHEKNGMAKLSRDAVLEIRRLFQNRVRQVDLAKQFGVTTAQICNIVHGKQWAFA